MQLQTIRRLKAKIENWVNTTSVEIQNDLAEDVAETLEKNADKPFDWSMEWIFL